MSGKENVVYVEYYPLKKKNEFILFAGKWMELKIHIVNQISQSQKDKYCMFSSYADSRFKRKKNINIKEGLFGWESVGSGRGKENVGMRGM
jgi:hypothetical protein